MRIQEKATPLSIRRLRQYNSALTDGQGHRTVDDARRRITSLPVGFKAVYTRVLFSELPLL